MKKITNSILITALIIFSGCASKTKIEKVSDSKSHFDNAVYEGQDFYESNENHNEEQYRVFHQASTGFSGTSGIRRSSENRAKSFCL
ncbi:MAG: hypothetical protein PF437_00020 [Sulfurimonas sp.]|nr:hypothetical protein [Sulfurimonas sp.]